MQLVLIFTTSAHSPRTLRAPYALELHHTERVVTLLKAKARVGSNHVGWYVLLSSANGGGGGRGGGRGGGGDGGGVDSRRHGVRRHEIPFKSVEGMSGVERPTTDAQVIRYVVELHPAPSNQHNGPRLVSVENERVMLKCDSTKGLRIGSGSWGGGVSPFTQHYVVWHTAFCILAEVPCWLAGSVVAVTGWRLPTLWRRIRESFGGVDDGAGRNGGGVAKNSEGKPEPSYMLHDVACHLTDRNQRISKAAAAW